MPSNISSRLSPSLHIPAFSSHPHSYVLTSHTLRLYKSLLSPSSQTPFCFSLQGNASSRYFRIHSVLFPATFSVYHNFSLSYLCILHQFFKAEVYSRKHNEIFSVLRSLCHCIFLSVKCLRLLYLFCYYSNFFFLYKIIFLRQAKREKPLNNFSPFTIILFFMTAEYTHDTVGHFLLLPVRLLRTSCILLLPLRLPTLPGSRFLPSLTGFCDDPAGMLLT